MKTGNNLPASGPSASTSQPSGLSSLLGPSLRQPINMSLTKSFSLSLNDSKDPGKDLGNTEFHRFTPASIKVSSIILETVFRPDTCSTDTLSVSSQSDELCVRILVRTGDQTEVNTFKAQCRYRIFIRYLYLYRIEPCCL